MLQTYYAWLSNRILTDDVLSELKIAVDWYLRQYYTTRGSEDDGIIVDTPVAYIELMPITWRTMPQSIQRAILTFRIHILTETVFLDERNFVLPESGPDTNNNHLPIRERIYKILMNQRVKLSDLDSYLGAAYRIDGADAVIMESIVRISSPTTSEMMNNLVLSIEEFQCVITDYTASPLYQKVDPPITLEQECIIGENDFTTSISTPYVDICIGGMVMLTGTVDGGIGDIQYQWQRFTSGTWTDITGANDSEYLTPQLLGTEGTQYTYRLKVIRLDFISYSDEMTITLNLPPDAYVYITEDDNIITPSETININSEVVGGIGGISYQWQHQEGSAWEDIAGATTSVLVVDGSTWTVGDHAFRVHVTQPAGCEAYSTAQHIIITP